jgi:transcriptional regulator with XRE-family HTH domain
MKLGWLSSWKGHSPTSCLPRQVLLDFSNLDRPLYESLLIMRAIRPNQNNTGDTPVMRAGRPSKSERTPFGQRLLGLRERAGLSQQQLADRLGISQRAYAHWERQAVTLRPDRMVKLAQSLSVSVEDLIGNGETKRRSMRPAGKMRRLFEAASQLPRSQQQKIAAVIEAFVAQHSNR